MNQDRWTLLEAYLDGGLSGEELARFEAMLASDAELRAEVEAQKRIDASLRRVVVPREVPLPGEPARGLKLAPGNRREVMRFALAAMMLLAIAGVFYAVMTAPERARGRLQPDEAYTQIVMAEKFVPMEVCTDEAQFLSWMQRQHKLAMVIPSDLPGVELVGWTYKNIMDYSTSVLMARVEGEPVIVLIEDRDVAQRLSVPRESGLRIFRRNLGTVAMYEVTPRDKPALIGHAELRGE